MKKMSIIASKEEFDKVRKKDFNSYKNLPFPVYTTEADSGKFLEMNDAAMSLFFLDEKKSPMLLQ